jgi:hypothetical protein
MRLNDGRRESQPRPRVGPGEPGRDRTDAIGDAIGHGRDRTCIAEPADQRDRKRHRDAIGRDRTCIAEPADRCRVACGAAWTLSRLRDLRSRGGDWSTGDGNSPEIPGGMILTRLLCLRI